MTDTTTRPTGRPAEHQPTNGGPPSRVPPSNLDAERALLSACLTAPDAIVAAASIIRTDDFYLPAHAHIWHALQDLHDTGRAVDAITVADHLDRHGLLDQAGGRRQLAELLGSPTSINAPRYARIVAEHAAMRELIAVGHQVAEIGWAQPPDTAAATNEARALLDELVARQEGARRRLHRIGDTLDDYCDLLEARHAGQVPGIPTGWDDLDHLLGGLRAGQLIVIAGRPAMGKSVVGGQLARHAATTGAPTLSASIEMGLDELLDRHMAGVARIPANNLRDGIIPPNDWARIAEATGKLADLPLWILDDAAATVPGIRTAAAKVFNTHPVADGPRGLVVVDYLQIITAAVASGNRVVDIGAISGGLKRLAREFDCAVVALAQLNRGLEARVDKRPTLPDLRESGSIENDADVVIGLYRDDYYDHESKEKGILEMIVLKQRSGPTGTIRTAFNAPWQRIDNMARGSH